MYLLQPHPILTTIHGFSITAHGSFFALGAVIGTFFLIYQRHLLSLSFNDVLERAVVIFIVGILGARLGYVIAYPTTWQSLGDILAIWQGGLVSFTGILVGLGMVAWYARKTSPNIRLIWYSLVIQATLLAWSIGRLGNYYAAESGGVASHVWSLTYGRVPIQLFEALGCLILFLVLRFTHFSLKNQIYSGLLGYFILRFLVDFWRDEASLGLHVSQWVSLLAIIILVVQFRKKRVQA